MSKRRELARHGSPVDRISKQLLNESAHIISAGIQQPALAAIEKRAELNDVARVS